MGIKGRALNSTIGEKKKFSESDIAQVVIDHFNDVFEVYPEVPTSNGICDIIVKDKNIITAIEVKKSFSFDVLEQAIRNKTIAHYSLIAVPRFNNMGFKKQLCRDYGIGLILVDIDVFNNNSIAGILTEQVALLNRHIHKPKLEEWMKRSVSGSKNDRMTAFKIMIEDLEHKLKRAGGAAEFEDIFDTSVSTYSSIHSAKNTLRSHVRNGVVKSFKFEGSKIILT